ncbi:hypothetical protein ADL12_07800 [Streptomyces regalis]|uniref:Uncharacterized protein n=1 Tax=Streptomyces regalis TaxID=68262 RepID=A0A0X3VFF9_9ACTN|nr:hypothetical protein ADL12_07800 [Streptomyces regalis]
MLHCALRLGDPVGPGLDEQNLITRIKACVACVWSDYSPAGVPLMAGPACFRDAKDLYRRCDGKHGPHGILAIWQERTEFAQETWLCEEFEHRTSDRGYRGPFPHLGTPW